IRILAGGMLLYTHLVWTLDLEAFFGPHAWISHEVVAEAREPLALANPYLPVTSFWSPFWRIESPEALWTMHVASLAVFASLMLGFCSRTMSVLAYLIAVSYVGRV